MTPMTTKELARLLKVSPRTIARWREKGTGPDYARIGGRIVYPESALVDWIAPRVETSVGKAA